MTNKRKRRCKTPKRNNRAKRQRPENDDEKTCATKIVDVNNDCLEHVFNHLRLMELINVASANKHLGQAAASVFARKYGKKMVEVLAQNFSSSVPETNVVEVTNDAILISKAAPAFRILRLFGGCISNIPMYGSMYGGVIPKNKYILAYINEYCSDSLKSLTLRGQNFTHADTKKPYKNVEKVSIGFGTIEFEASQFNDTFPKMHRLELRSNRYFNHKMFAGKFQQVEHLVLNWCDRLTTTDVRKIICLNPQLQSLSIYGVYSLKFWDYASKQLKQLNALELNYDENRFRNYPAEPIRFESVETLKLNIPRSRNKCKPKEVFTFKQLKECTLVGGLDDSWVNFAIGHPTIEKLKIIMLYPYSRFLTEHQMVQLAANLPNLIELYMTQCLCSVNAAIRFLNESQTVHKFSLTVSDKDDMDELYSRITPEWNATKMDELIVVERKE